MTLSTSQWPITVLSCDPFEKMLGDQLLSQSFHEHAREIDEALHLPETLPFLWVKPYEEKERFQLGIYCLGPFRQRFFKYFYEFCFNICLQQHEPDPLSCTAIDFISHNHPKYARLTICRIQMQLQSQEELVELTRALLNAKEQLRPGMWTRHLSDWSAWQKMAAEDERITRLAKRWADLSLRMNPELVKFASQKLQQLIANLSKTLLADRSIKHILYIACAMALPLWRQSHSLKKKERQPLKRRAWISYSQRWVFIHDKRQLMDCYTITLNYLRSHETLDERHILQALKKHSGLTASSANFFMNFKDSNTKFHHFYLEIPFDYASFSSGKQAPPSLRNFDERILSCIERKQLRIFQPRNDEESLKRLVNLSKEVQTEQDIAQVILSFDEQTDEKLIFCLLLARPVESFQKGLCERTIGDIQIRVEKRRKMEEVTFSKELIMARVELAKNSFVREDYSVDLHRCRLYIMHQLASVLGPLRDYNGGLIAKQQRLLEQVLEKLSPLTSHQQIVVEEVFFSLQPCVATGSFELESLASFFLHLLQAESMPKQNFSTSWMHWKSEGSLIFLAAFSDERESFSGLCELFQERLNEGKGLVYGQVQQPYRFLQVALLEFEEAEEAKNLKHKIRKLLKPKGEQFQLQEKQK